MVTDPFALWGRQSLAAIVTRLSRPFPSRALEVGHEPGHTSDHRLSWYQDNIFISKGDRPMPRQPIGTRGEAGGEDEQARPAARGAARRDRLLVERVQTGVRMEKR